MHQEVGPGVHFGDAMAKLATGNSVDVAVVTAVVGSDVINGSKYVRIESRRNGDLWLTEWCRQAANGLMLGKTVDAETGQQVVMAPPQILLSPTLAPGETWDWKATAAPVVMHVRVVGPADVSVPAGVFHATQLGYVMTVQTEGGEVKVQQTRWFAPGVGYVKQDTETRQGDRLLTHVILELDKH